MFRPIKSVVIELLENTNFVFELVFSKLAHEIKALLIMFCFNNAFNLLTEIYMPSMIIRSVSTPLSRIAFAAL
jgi:hypothetical protein